MPGGGVGIVSVGRLNLFDNLICMGKKAISASQMIRLDRLLMNDKYLPDDFKVDLRRMAREMEFKEFKVIVGVLEDMQDHTKQVLNELAQNVRTITVQTKAELKKIKDKGVGQKKVSILGKINKIIKG